VGPNETVLGHYDFMEGRWVVHTPAIVPPAHRELVQRLVNREKFGRARRYADAKYREAV
jgi:hypothetical protein